MEKFEPLTEDQLRWIEQQAGSGFRPPPEDVLRLVDEVRRLRERIEFLPDVRIGAANALLRWYDEAQKQGGPAKGPLFDLVDAYHVVLRDLSLDPDDPAMSRLASPDADGGSA